MKELNPQLIADFSYRWETASGKIEKGKVVQEMMSMLGISKGTVYRKLQSVQEGRSVFDLSANKRKSAPRKPAVLREQERRDALEVAALKRKNSDENLVPTEKALLEAMARGLLSKNYTRSTMDRLLQKYGLNKESITRPKAAVRIEARHSNHVMYVDATVLDHYYLNIEDNKTIIEINAPKNDQHLDDILHRRKAKKIWVYYAIEKYSKAYFVMAFAPEPVSTNSKNGGENSIDLLKFLSFVFLPKKNLPSMRGTQHPYEGAPIEGAPHFLYSDKGSALTSGAVANFLYNLGITPETHMPGNPRAKGFVEARIGAAKRGPDRLINRNTIHTLDDLNYHLMSWSHYDNTVQKKYIKFIEGTKHNPIRQVEQQNIIDASILQFVRTVNHYGEISINNVSFFVNENIVGEKVRIHRKPAQPGERRLFIEDQLIAIDRFGRKYELTPQTSHYWGEFSSFAKTEEDKLSDESLQIASALKRSARFEDTLPPKQDGNLAVFPPRKEKVETHSRIAPAVFPSVQEAVAWVKKELELLNYSISAASSSAMQSEFQRVHNELGFIPGDMASTFYKIIFDNRKVG